MIGGHDVGCSVGKIFDGFILVRSRIFRRMMGGRDVGCNVEIFFDGVIFDGRTIFVRGIIN